MADCLKGPAVRVAFKTAVAVTVARASTGVYVAYLKSYDSHFAFLKK
ncbi:hypothetical protein [Mesobacillus zeae]